MDFSSIKNIDTRGGYKYEPELWDLTKEEHEINNCYSYILNRIEKNLKKKLQPGELSNSIFNNYDCNEISNKIMIDFPSITPIDNIDSPIPCDHYRIALVLDKLGEHLDYHFYRQDLDGYWSHKTGHDPISNVDASNKLINNPEHSDRNYDKKNNDRFNYDIFCGYFSVKKI